MAETRWVIDTPDGKKIYGILNSPDKKKNSKVIIHVHGLYGNQYDYAATRMALTLPKQGYDVIRFNLYWWEEGGRSMMDCTIKQHAADIDLVFRHFKKKYKKLFATGHSYGGPCLMSAKVNQFNAVSLWDPSYLPSETVNKKDYIKSGKYYIDPIASPITLGKPYIDEAAKFGRDHSVKLSKKCTAPLQVIYADNDSYWIHKGESFHTHAKGLTDEKIVKKTQHFFFEEGAPELLLRHLRKWFDQF